MPNHCSYNLDEHLFNENANLEILQIRWHPASPTDSHILALLSDNSIRVYDVDALRHVWRVGPSPSLVNGGAVAATKVPLSTSSPTTRSTAKLAYLNSLGDTAVDFDIAPPRVVSGEAGGAADLTTTTLEDTSYSTTGGGHSFAQPKRSKGGKIEWPIVILRGDGNVDDNYGLDSCSLVVVPSLPPTIIIAESSGKTHHALLLEEESPAERSLTELDSSLVLYPCEWYLQVLETVELELGLAGVDEARTYSCPIHLKRDLLNESRYFAYHNAGLHAVTMDFTRQLVQFVENDDDLNEKYPLFNSQSRAEYVVCTKALPNSSTNSVLGFALLSSPPGILLQLASGQVVTLDLISDHSKIRDWNVAPGGKSSLATDSTLKKMMKDSFQDRIQTILKSGTTQPILKLDQTAEPTPQESFELLTQATKMLREHYFVKHEKARQEIERRVHVLKLLKQQQLSEIDQLQQEKQQIRDTAERLAENYEDICDKQSALFKRAQEVVRLATLRLPKGSFSENKFADMIEKIGSATRQLERNVDQAKQKITAQQVQVEQARRPRRSGSWRCPPSRRTSSSRSLGRCTHKSRAA
ncbi:hypothetical protein pipiens_010921 [Culex pipiens pipiens]|uniref:Nuclear pore complex protein Nup88 n=1 Tax=Culex pipiens pipiens TaxID=38569 RepID=A0ABD1D8U2_CULPP